MKIIYKDGHVDECPQDQELHVIRHTAAHVMAQAIKRLYPEADFAFGPATENGFYYDVDLGDTKLTDEDLANIEKEMRKITKENLAIKPFILPRAEAVKLMEERHENYKVEHMADLADETEFSFFQQGEYVDMCIGPHLTYTKALKAFKITQQSGAYWKNDKENKMLTRINGVAFHNQEELDAWEKEQQEARERDHRKIGKEMGLFMTDDLVGRGLPMFLPAGYTVWQELENYIKEKERARGYLHVMTPCIGTVNLYKTSGHWDHYRENMFPAMEMEGESYVLRPMNCPHHMMIYANRPHSYRDLPMRIGEIAHDFRYEATGKEKLQQLWAAYFQEEKEIYAQLLKNPDEVVKGTVKELADKFKVSLMTMTGFLDGINDSLVEQNPIDDLEEDTQVNLGFDKALLYKNMVAAEADWLYNLEEWNDIFDEETRKELYKEQKSSTTIVKEQKVYPNDPCPCGSGKKYKKCCGRK